MESQGRYAEYRQEVLEQTKLWPTVRRGFPSWWSTLADTLGIVAVIVSVAIGQQASLINPILLLVIAVAALIAALLSHRRAQRTVGYAYGGRGLHTAVHILRNELARVESWTDGEIKSCLQEVLGAFATSFSMIVNAPCRACIKVVAIIPPSDKTEDEVTADELIECAYARTLCRDFGTAAQIGHGDQSATEAPVRTNTAFNFLFLDVRNRHFVCNNIPKEMGRGKYQNTSIDKYKSAGDEAWSLPYRATMVWPIRLRTTTPMQSTAAHHFTGTQDIIGYLAIDTVKVNAFRPAYDFDLGALLADALYIFLSTVSEPA